MTILQLAAPDAFFSGRVAANLLLTEERLQALLAEGIPTEALLERFARFADMPVSWFYLKPEDI